MGPLWLLSSMTTKLGTWDGEHKVSRAENIDYLALKTQTVHLPGTERAHSSDAWQVVSTPHGPGPERLREAPGPREWEPSQCGSTPWKSGQRGTPWTPKETEDPDCSSPFCQRCSDTLGYPPTPGLSTGCLPRVSRVPCSGSHPVSSNSLHPFPTAEQGHV